MLKEKTKTACWYILWGTFIIGIGWALDHVISTFLPSTNSRNMGIKYQLLHDAGGIKILFYFTAFVGAILIGSGIYALCTGEAIEDYGEEEPEEILEKPLSAKPIEKKKVAGFLGGDERFKR